MIKYLLNYANLKYFKSQVDNTHSAMTVGGFDAVFQCGEKDIDKEFYDKNNHILTQSRGAGYWLWKPYLIDKKLQEIDYGDILFYCDSGSYFIGRIDPIIKICINETPGLMCFHINAGDPKIAPDIEQTKRDVYVLMGCDNEEYWYNNYPVAGTYQVWVKNDFSQRFVKEWLIYAQDERIITDLPNQCGLPNLSEFKNHRHDQSILSILRKKYNLPTFTDLSQFGNPYRKGKIPHTIHLHRSGQ